MEQFNQAEFESKAKKMVASYLGIDEKEVSMAWFRKVKSNEAVLCVNVDPGPYSYCFVYFDVLYLSKRGRYIMTVYSYEDCTFYDDELLLNEKQKSCPYCHEPYEIMPMKAKETDDYGEKRWACYTNRLGHIQYKVYTQRGYDSEPWEIATESNPQFCEMCGRDLRSDEKFRQTYREEESNDGSADKSSTGGD